MKAGEIVKRLRSSAAYLRGLLATQPPYTFADFDVGVLMEREEQAADALDAQAAEIARLRADVSEWKRQAAIVGMESDTEIASMRKAFETIFPARDGFTEAFDDLVSLGLLVEVPSDAAFRDWWGDEPTMWVWRWHPLATPSATEETT